MSEKSILGQLDKEHLQNIGLLRPGLNAGSQRIHKRRLNRSSDEEYQDIPLDIHPSSTISSDAFATIPMALISHETLAYLGFSAGKCNEMWTNWVNWPATGPGRETDPDDGCLRVTFLDFATAQLESIDDVCEDNDEQWYQCLSACGMSESVQEAIMDPHFKNIRLTNSCVFWVTDTIAMRYAGLEDFSRASRQREMELARARTRQAGGGSGSASGSGSGSGFGGEGRGSRAQTGVQRAVSGLQQQTAPGISSVLWSSATAADVQNKPGHIVLFKGLDQGRISGLFNDAGEVKGIEKLLSSAPSDFSGTRALFHFTPDPKVAEYHAAYAKRRANCESVVIVCLTIRQDAIDELEEPEIYRLYWPSPQWKQLVWLSKQVKSLPKPLRKYRDALLIIGTIAKGAARQYESVESWTDMTDVAVLRAGWPENSPSVQFVFSGEEDGREFLVQKGGFEAFPFSASELEALIFWAS